MMMAAAAVACDNVFCSSCPKLGTKRGGSLGFFEFFVTIVSYRVARPPRPPASPCRIPIAAVCHFVSKPAAIRRRPTLSSPLTSGRLNLRWRLTLTRMISSPGRRRYARTSLSEAPSPDCVLLKFLSSGVCLSVLHLPLRPPPASC